MGPVHIEGGQGAGGTHKQTPQCSVFYARGHVIYLHPVELQFNPTWSVKIEFKPHAEFALKRDYMRLIGSEREDQEINSFKK